MCNHDRQIHKQTFVELKKGQWTSSTLIWMCIDCHEMGFNTPKEAFLSDDVKRKIEITRDDRQIVI